MEITIYKIATGKIVSTLRGPSAITDHMEEGESYINGKFPLNGSIENGEYVAKIYPFPLYPADSIIEAMKYLSIGVTPFKQSLSNIGMSQVEIDSFITENYSNIRKAVYPVITDFLDAQVKLSSTDSDTVRAGQEQMDKYLTDSLAVKERFPKPVV